MAKKKKKVVKKTSKDSNNEIPVEEAMNIIAVPIRKIVADAPDRDKSDYRDIGDLAVNIAENGLLQPCRAVYDSESNKYHLIVGKRRLAAVKKLKWKNLPCIVTSGEDDPASELIAVLSDNIHRKAVNPYNRALCYQMLLDEDQGAVPSISELSRRIGVSQPQISKTLKILDLPEKEQKAVKDGKLSATLAVETAMKADSAVAEVDKKTGKKKRGKKKASEEQVSNSIQKAQDSKLVTLESEYLQGEDGEKIESIKVRVGKEVVQITCSIPIRELKSADNSIVMWLTETLEKLGEEKLVKAISKKRKQEF